MKGVLLAPNCFRGSISSFRVADALKAGLLKVNKGIVVKCIPLADGGDGTLSVVRNALNLKIQKQICKGLNGRSTVVPFGINMAGTVVVEAAKIVGLETLSPGAVKKPLQYNSSGLGELLSRLPDENVRSVILCLGGSAIVDAGLGVLTSLGMRVLDKYGRNVPPIPSLMNRITKVESDLISEKLRRLEVIMICDTNLPLLGKDGALSTFGPQKGLSESEMAITGSLISNWCGVLANHYEVDFTRSTFSGCNGGVAFALMTAFGFKAVYGADWVMDLLNFNDYLGGGRILVTGEGRLDNSTFTGKAPYRAAVRAELAGSRSICIAGTCVNDLDRRKNIFTDIFPFENNVPYTISKEYTRLELMRIGEKIAEIAAL